MARTGLTQRQLACAVLAALVSLLSFAGVLQGTRSWWQGQGGTQADVGSLMAVRLIEGGDADAGAVLANTYASGMPFPRHPLARLTHEPDEPDEPVQGPVQVAALKSAIESASQSSSESAPQTAPQTAPQSATEFESQSAIGYVPAAELSERPVLLQDLDPVLELPASVSTGTGAADTSQMPDSSSDSTLASTATGILLINAQGGVDRLLFDTPGYPRYLEAMLAQRFADVRFLPGKIDGKPVPSALRIRLQLQ